MRLRSAVVVAAAVLSVIVQAACRAVEPAPLDAPEPGAAAAQAAGLSGPIELRIDGDPDDAPGADPATLTLAAAVEAAVRHDPRVQQALARWEGLRAESEGARILPNPILSLGLGLTGLSAPKVTVGLTQEIAAYLQRPHRVGAADARLRAAAEDVLTSALDAVAGVREAYASIQWTEAQLPVLAARRDILTRLVEFERLKLERGESVQADVTTLDAERAAVAVDVADREAELRAGRVALARLVGRPSSAAGWTLDARVAPAPPDGAERDWVAGALSRRPEIRALGWELAALGEERALVATWPWEGSAGGVEAEYDDGFSMGPTLDLPLRIRDPGGPRDAAAAAAEAEMRHRVTETRRLVIEDVRTAWAALESSQRTLDVVATELLPLLERRRAELETTFRAGEGDVVSLLLADQALQEVRARRIELEGRAALARIRLERAAGGAAQASTPRPGTNDAPRGETPR